MAKIGIFKYDRSPVAAAHGMNRGGNTIGSKCSDVRLARIVVDIKAELEKIREQTQNIE